MRITAALLILLCLAACAHRAEPDGGNDLGLWPNSQITRDVAAISAGMNHARATADSMAARRGP